MESNNFVAKLKANGSAGDITDLTVAFEEYKTIFANLPAKERGLFALNVFCILCRNLDKIPEWRSQIDYRPLIEISMQCVKDSRSLSGDDKIKVLGCVYHLQKNLVYEQKELAPELVLKSSFLAFEDKTLLENYGKTYWNIIVDRFNYIEKLKTNKANIIKFLEITIQHTIKIILIYDMYQFISNCLQFLVKKLHFLYSDFYNQELSKAILNIFKSFSKKKDEKLKGLQQNEVLDMYVKMNYCIVILAENESKILYKNSVLNPVVKTCVSLLGNHMAVFQCYQTYHLNFLCSLLTEKCDSMYIQTIFSNMIETLNCSEQNSQKIILESTVPFLYQVLKLFIEYVVTNASKIQWKANFDAGAQLKCLQFTLMLMSKLYSGKQILKCENCTVNSGLHDALRLSFLTKSLITTSLNEKIDIKTVLKEYYVIITEQLNIISELTKLQCVNHGKCLKKIQTDMHNTAILLNKHSHYDYSIKLFNLYLQNELKCDPINLDYKNISRAFYNKAICEMDNKLFKMSLISAGLSQLFAHKEELNDKQMGLIIDVKAKQLNSISDELVYDLQNLSLLDIYKMAIQENNYGDLKRFFGDLNFSCMLRHEFSAYTRLWPSLVPVAGVWRSLYELANKKHEDLLILENETKVMWVLYEVILKSVSSVRTIHGEAFEDIVGKILDSFDTEPPSTLELKVVHSSLKIIQGEYDLRKASDKHGWKIDSKADPDKVCYSRTVSDEHAALKNMLEAVTLWTELTPKLIKSSKFFKGPYLSDVLNILELGALNLLNCGRLLEGLQMSHLCCVLAEHCGYKLTYVRSASVILYYARSSTCQIKYMMNKCGEYIGELGKGREHINWVLMYVCNSAIYSFRSHWCRVAAQLVQYTQSRILELQKDSENSDINLDMAVGHLLEAQTVLCGNSESPTILSSIMAAQRHYLNINTTASSFHSTRYNRLLRSLHIAAVSLRAVVVTAQLQWWRRATATAATLPTLAAADWARVQAAACNTSLLDETRAKLESNLKYVLGLQFTETNDDEEQKEPKTNTQKSRPKIMVNSKLLKQTQVDENDEYLNVPAFKMASFFNHESDCLCYACETPYTYIYASKCYNLEAAAYFKAKESDIAKNYFAGALKTVSIVEDKLKNYRQKKSKYESYLLDVVEQVYRAEFSEIEVELLIDAAFFELSLNNFLASDDYIVRIYEIRQEIELNKYLNSEVNNLLCASAKIRNSNIKSDYDIEELEKDLSLIQLSPRPPEVQAKTPENKSKKPPKLTKNVIDKEELPERKPQAIKFKLEEIKTDDEEVKTRLDPDFKVPVPKICKPSLELMTPLKTRHKIAETFKTPCENRLEPPKAASEQFNTPKSESPEQFFTPMTSIKSYANKSKTASAIKNLKEEFGVYNALKSGKSDKSSQSSDKSDQTSVKSVKTNDKSIKDGENLGTKTLDESTKAKQKATAIPKTSLRRGKSTKIPELKDKENIASLNAIKTENVANLDSNKAQNVREEVKRSASVDGSENKSVRKIKQPTKFNKDKK